MTSKSINRDPVYALIERQKQLGDNWSVAVKNEPMSDTPKYRIWYKREGRACKAYNAGIDKLLRTKPTTSASAVALIEFCLNEDTCLFRNNGCTDECVALLELICKAIPTLKQTA
jgi:hypothetical protein